MTKAKAKESVAELEATLAALEAKRAELRERATRLPEVRRSAAYLAHVEGDADARRELDSVADEVARHQSEMDSVADAIAEATDKLHIAQSAAAHKVKRKGAKQAVEILARFKQTGADMDQALAAVVQCGNTSMQLLAELHRASGMNFPTREQVDALGYASLMTAILKTPWARSLRPLPPSQRREFRQTFEAWASVLEGRLKSLLDDAADAEAA
jgi:hypothetical protein